jgi:hypothetical protein
MSGVLSKKSDADIETTINELFDAHPAVTQIKIRVHEETKQASLIDVVRLVTGQNQDNASKVVRRMMDGRSEDRASGPYNIRTDGPNVCSKLRINGKGRETWVADAPTLVQIIWDIPGKAAKEFRRQSAHYICRILGGDRTLIDEIEMRYDRTPKEVKEFMTANVERPVMPERSEDELNNVLKRKREDAEIVALELANKERALKIKKDELDFYTQCRDCIPNDARLQSACDDNIRALICNGSKPAVAFKYLPDFSSILREEYNVVLTNSKLAQLGKLVSDAYQKKYGSRNTEKVQRLVDGAIRPVNAYLSKDKDLVYGVIAEYMGKV